MQLFVSQKVCNENSSSLYQKLHYTADVYLSSFFLHLLSATAPSVRERGQFSLPQPTKVHTVIQVDLSSNHTCILNRKTAIFSGRWRLVVPSHWKTPQSVAEKFSSSAKCVFSPLLLGNALVHEPLLEQKLSVTFCILFQNVKALCRPLKAGPKNNFCHHPSLQFSALYDVYTIDFYPSSRVATRKK